MKIAKIDNDLQIAYGEVYLPDRLDTDGEYITAEGVTKMAHEFLAKGEVRVIDIMHDYVPVPAKIIESFVARKGDPDFIPFSWVIAIHVEDVAVWRLIKDGALNGFSMSGTTNLVPKDIEIEIPQVIDGETLENEGHTHTLTVQFSDAGEFMGGQTSYDHEHQHTIRGFSVTEPAQGHTHRYSIMDAIGADYELTSYEPEEDTD